MKIAKIQFVEVLYEGFARIEEWTKDGRPQLVVRTTDSVSGLLYDSVNDRVLLVKQCRPAMVRDDNPTGLITETVAGRVDVDLGPQALLVKEAREEAGVHLKEEDVVLLNHGVPVAKSPGVLIERTHLAFTDISLARVEEGDTGYGVKEEGEEIDRVWVGAETFITMQHDCLTTFAFAQFLMGYRFTHLKDLVRQ